MTNSFFWQLPAPSEFLAAIEQDVMDGNNILLLVPEHTPGDLWDVLWQRFDDAPWQREHVPADAPGSASPLTSLFERFATDIDVGAIRTAATFANAVADHGKLFWTPPIPAPSHGAWGKFLANYAHAVSIFPQEGRSLFCCTFLGTPVGQFADVCLKVHQWPPPLDEFEMLLYAHRQIHPCRSPLQNRVAAAIVASLALWDPTVVDAFSDASLEEILDPFPRLAEFAAAREWDRGTTVAWERGTANQGGRLHAAMVAVQKDMSELRYRIWRGEIAVLLPYVEECRRTLLERYGTYLYVPYQTQYSEITRLNNLEIGHIARQLLDRRNALDPRLLITVKLLHRVRNDLAHLDTVQSQDICSLNTIFL